MSRVIFQIGFVKNRKKTQSVKAFLNDQELSWSDNSGRFLTTLKDKQFKGMTFYMYELDMQLNDVLKLEIKTFLSGVGVDEEKTFESLYYADDEAPVREIEISEVGIHNYPLIKGRILEIGSVSEMDKRKADIDDFINKGF